MRTLLLSLLSILCCVLFLSCNSSQTSLRTNPDTSDWIVYRNDKYGYQIKYPRVFDLSLTGLPEQRDGKTFSIEKGDISIFWGLQTVLYPGLSVEEILKMSWKIEQDSNSKELPDILESIRDSIESWKWEKEVIITKVIVNGEEGVKFEYRWPTGQLSCANIIINGATFTYNAEDFEEIISTFRFVAQ